MTANITPDNQYYTIECNNIYFTLPLRYEDPVTAGQGGFGAVIRAKDTKLNRDVAIKKMLKPFDNAALSKRTYLELKLLTYLNHPDAQVVQLLHVFTPDKNLEDFRSLYFVFNFAEYDLDQVIQRGMPFAEEHIRQVIYSILRGLKFMHSAGIIHRDLKPSNIGTNEESDITILDFGLARVASKGIQTGYVCTRWWRAPEICTSWERYNEKLDIWSVGCIMAELVVLRPIFRGTDRIDQIKKIFEIVGTPDKETVDAICQKEPATYINGLPRRPKQDYNQLFGFKYGESSSTPISGISPAGIDLLDRLLSFDHRKRPSAEEALAHPFFETLHDSEDEPTIERMIDEHDDATHSVSTWKSIIWQMVQEFQPPTWITSDA